jgi:hypothetical protein
MHWYFSTGMDVVYAVVALAIIRAFAGGRKKSRERRQRQELNERLAAGMRKAASR